MIKIYSMKINFFFFVSLILREINSISFYSRIKDETMNATVKDYDILFSITLINSEIKAPQDQKYGSFVYNSTGEVTDIFSQPEQKEKVKKAIKEKVEEFSEKYKTYLEKISDYSSLSIEELVTFITVDNSEVQDFVANLIKKVVQDSEVPTMDFSFENYNQSAYNSKGRTPTLGVLSGYFSVGKFGFGYMKKCRKYLSKLPLNKNINKLLPKPEEVSSFKAKFFPDKQKEVFYSSKIIPIYNFSKEQLETNLTLWKDICDEFIFDSLIDENFQKNYEYRKTFIDSLPKSILYFYSLRTGIDNYFQLAPFFTFMIEVFNSNILKDLKDEKYQNIPKNKAILIGVYDNIIAGIYQLFLYDGEISAFGEIDYTELANQLPSIKYGESIYFELIKEKNADTFYIQAKNSADEILFTLDTNNFSSLMDDILIEPQFIEENILRFCGDYY